MQLRTRRPAQSEGTALLVTLLIAGVAGVLLYSYLTVAQREHSSAFHSQGWNNALAVTEAGVEDALGLINSYVGTIGSLQSWTNAASGNGWSSPAANVYYVRRYINGDFYDVYVTNLNNTPNISAKGYFQANSKYASLSASASGPTLTRSVLVKTKLSGAYNMAVLTRNGISVSSGTLIDSFNSADPNYSTGGQYVPAKHRDGGTIGVTVSNVTAAVHTGGGAVVYGKIAVGPNSTVDTSGISSAGSTGWVDGGNKGLQSGWLVKDLIDTIADVSVPNVAWWSSASLPGTSGTVSGTTYDYVITSGNYQVTSAVVLKNSQAVLISGQVNLYLQSDFSSGGQATITVPPNSSLSIYTAGNMSLGGSGLVNSSGNVTNVAVYGLPSCTSIGMTGSSGFVGTIYAPEADVSLAGGGSTGMNYVGALVANTVSFNGNYQLHYDEALLGCGPGACYAVTSWQELVP